MADHIEGALFDAQAELYELELTKDARNPHFKNRYLTLDALLEAVVPVLRNHQILVAQVPVETSMGDLGLRTVLKHVPSGESVEGVFPLNKLQKDDPQGQGSALTYARRYALMAMLMLTADEDDDGNAARKPKGPSAAVLKRKAFDLAKTLTGKDEPTKAEAAKALGIKVGELVDVEVLTRVLTEHKAI